jgi:hypothetical protein
VGKKNFKLNKEGFRQIRQSPQVRADLKRRADNLAQAAGGQDMGYKVTMLALEDPRGAVSVMATGHAARHNRKHNTLIRKMDAARD